jgi:1-acyl-sn-glycerol-3-phosphate acyltransferase
MVKRFGDWLRDVFPWVIRHYNRLEVRGMNNLPRKGSAIIAPNHSGGMDLDNFCVMSALEHFNTSNPARKRIWLCYWDEWSAGENLWSKWVRKFSPIPISLTGKGIPYSLVDKIVERGELLAIMPEGHSAALSEGYRLWRFYPGVIKLHVRYDIPIIPTACIGFVKACPIFSNRYNPSKTPPWEGEVMSPILFPRKLIIHFGEPLTFDKEKDHELGKRESFLLAAEVRDEVSDLISLYRKGVTWTDPLGKKTKMG